MNKHISLIGGLLALGLFLALAAPVVRATAEFNEPEWRGMAVGVEPFLSAAAAGDVAGVRRFLDAGIDVNIRDAEGRTALYAAARGGRLETVALLAAAGADVNLETRDGRNALDAAKEKGAALVVELLVRLGARKSTFAERTNPSILLDPNL